MFQPVFAWCVVSDGRACLKACHCHPKRWNIFHGSQETFSPSTDALNCGTNVSYTKAHNSASQILYVCSSALECFIFVNFRPHAILKWGFHVARFVGLALKSKQVGTFLFWDILGELLKRVSKKPNDFANFVLYHDCRMNQHNHWWLWSSW